MVDQTAWLRANPRIQWMAVSADGLFAGAAVSGLALVCLGANRRRPRSRR